MKKWMGMVLAMCLLLTACGGNTSQAPEQEEPVVTEEEPAQPQQQPETPEGPGIRGIDFPICTG